MPWNRKPFEITRHINQERSIPYKTIKASITSRAHLDENGMKRLFVCCDGTWKNASNTIAPPTNVARLARSVDRHGHDIEQAVPQITSYAGGIGTTSVLPVPLDYLYSGLTGEGLERSILEAYCFLCNNFNFASGKDDIILIGFSRGAFAARCLACFISEIGLIRRKHLSLLPNVFESWWRGKGKIDPKYREAEISLPVRIKVLAEWDTVSALWGQRFGFVQGDIPSVVDHAFQAIAIDEQRLSFQPMLWTNRGQSVEQWEPESADKSVEQCLFSGHHGDIGGGNLDAGLSTVALLWMASKIKSVTYADFDMKTLLQAILPVSSTTFADDTLRGRPAPILKYENLLLSKGHVNPPSWWWSFQRYLVFNLFDGSRYHWLKDYLQKEYELQGTLKVHFTVPLLMEGAAKKLLIDNSIPEQVKLWDRIGFAWQRPGKEEVGLWKEWRGQAKKWKPDRKSKDEDMEDWGNIIETLNMQPASTIEGDPVVIRIFNEMQKRSEELCELFSQPYSKPRA
ncbi:hypothetical protein ABKA04_008530 [Annulohypoxylon sp. FPYF3050]